mmetsp:Transcript_6362/g.9945  ORF Transcript_6362/g.9945 Transcript_6362/m.9945 type:complete len:646 (+) Transcript_6362:187-2124(+)
MSHPRGHSIFVGDLKPEVNETDLMRVFEPIGRIESIRVCRDHHTQQSLGYAYINYSQADHAERALKMLNFTKISGKPCRVMWVNRDPYLRKSGKGNIHIKNLPEGTDNKGLHDLFEKYGEILSVKVPEKDGKYLNYGMVHFKTEESAKKAIAEMNDKDGMIVTPYIPSSEREKRPTNLFVKNLPVTEEFKEETLRKMFEECGEISSVKLEVEEDGKSKGYGYVAFTTPEDAKKAIDKLNNSVCEGKELFVGPFYSKKARMRQRRNFVRREKNEGTNIFIKNLADDIDEKKLNQIFGEYGEIKSAHVKVENGVHRGFGFVNFASQEAATKAVTAMNKQVVHNKLLYVALAQTKAERMRKLQEKYNRQQAMQNMYPGGVHPQAGFMFPQQQFAGRPVFIAAQPLVPRNTRFYPNAMQQQQQRMPNQMMQPQNAMRGGRGRGRKGGANYKLTANARNHQMQQQGMVQMTPQQMMAMQQGGAAPQYVMQQRGPQGQQQQQQQQQTQMLQNQMAALSIQAGGGQPLPQQGAQAQAPAPAPQQQQQQQLAQGQPAQQSELANTIAGLSAEDATEHLGELLYPKIQELLSHWDKTIINGPGDQAEKTGKITGMLLEMKVEDLVNCVEDDNLLQDQVKDALKILDDAAEEAQG